MTIIQNFLDTLHQHTPSFRELGVVQLFLDGVSQNEGDSQKFIYLTVVFSEEQNKRTNLKLLTEQLTFLFDAYVDIVMSSESGVALEVLHAGAKEVFCDV